MSAPPPSFHKLNTRPSASPVLWSGRLAGVADSHSDLLLARGFLPYRRPRGSCEVRGRSANLWYAAAKALGFEVSSMRCPDPLFVAHVRGLGMGVKSLAALPQRLRRPRRLPDVVFSDVESIPLGADAVEYWGAWTTTHLFYCLGSDDSVHLGGASPTAPSTTPLTPPPGWAARSICLAHHETGGATSGRWTFVVWYPPNVPWVEPLAWTPRGGTPLLCCVNDRVRATPYRGQRRSGVAGERVVREGGLVLDFGLFPAFEPTARVLVESSGSPSGYGSRCLSARELGDLWDVPILLLDSLSDAAVTELMEGICHSPPSKLLHTGADLLLTASFRGGLEGDGRPGASASADSADSALQPGPRPLTDAELGLCTGALSRSPEDLVEGLGQRPETPDTEVIKGDHQKADNAAVPDHLWLRAFALGYGDPAHPARHLEALNLPPTSAVGFLDNPRPPNGWRGALPGLRLFGLRHWRSRVTRDYISWRRANVPIGVCDKGKGPLVQCHWEQRAGGAESPAYTWASNQGSATGRRLYKAGWTAMRSTAEGKATVEAGHDAIHRCADASWFEWCKGSAPLFWNWGLEYQREVRDGQPHFMMGTPGEPFLRKQAKAKDPLKHELMRDKVVQVRRRGYIKPGEVTSGTHYFCVDKGETDIRMVYNGTSCGLNAYLHAPHYGLLTVKHTMRALREGYYQCDLDVGEQFLNYKLHGLLRLLSGVDVREVRSRSPADASWEATRPGNWERWERNWMGLRDSPYRSLQWQARLKLELYGDRRVRSNPFHWEKVIFNLPGSKGYRADLPWVFKLRWDGKLGVEVFVYVDDGRAIGPTEFLTWQAARWYGSGCTRRGVQDASRKRTSPSLTPGPWAGTVTHTEDGRICGMVSQEKWEKTKRLITEMLEMVSQDYYPLARLLQIRGFLMYVVRTYPWINPYMKGMHLTIDSWRPLRGLDGFKLRGKELESALALGLDGDMPCRRAEDDPKDEQPHVSLMSRTENWAEEAPVDVRPVARFLQDLEYLAQLTEAPTPPRQLYRARHTAALFVIGDASGKAKGAVVVTQYGLDYESGVWSQQWRGKSSNVREAENLTDRLERLAGQLAIGVVERLERLNEGAGLADHEVFVLTDNSAFEGAYYKGHSTSKELSDIVFRLYKAQRDGGFILHLLHISGKRMKATGVDGLSRGDHTEGMMAGEDPMSFLPLHLGADTRSQGRVGKWVRSWWRTSDQAPGPGCDRNWGGLPLEEVTQDNMFELKDMKAARLWMLPPAAMEVAIELLWEDKLAHPQWPHVFVVPRFMTHLWRRNLGKSADILFTVPAGVPFWGSLQFEPLIVAIVFPLAHVSSYTGPWSVKGTDMGLYFERALAAGFSKPTVGPPAKRPRLEDPREGGIPPANGPAGGGWDTRQLHDVDGPLPGVFDDPEAGSRALLRELLASAGRLPPVRKCLVRQVLQGVKKRPLPQAGRQPKRLRPGG